MRYKIKLKKEILCVYFLFIFLYYRSPRCLYHRLYPMRHPRPSLYGREEMDPLLRPPVPSTYCQRLVRPPSILRYVTLK